MQGSPGGGVEVIGEVDMQAAVCFSFLLPRCSDPSERVRVTAEDAIRYILNRKP